MICFSDGQLGQHGCGYLSDALSLSKGGGRARHGLLNDGCLDVQRTKAREPPIDDVALDRHVGRRAIGPIWDSI